MLLARIISFEARYVIPLAGMIIGNSMNAAALTVSRLTTDLKDNRLAIESALSLGKGWRVASKKYIRNSATAGGVAAPGELHAACLPRVRKLQRRAELLVEPLHLMAARRAGVEEKQTSEVPTDEHPALVE